MTRGGEGVGCGRYICLLWFVMSCDKLSSYTTAIVGHSLNQIINSTVNGVSCYC